MKRDRRLAGIVLTVSAVLLIGGLVAFAPDEPPPISDKVSADKQTTEPAADPRLDPSAHQQQAKKAEIKHRFDQAIAMLHAKQYDYAVKALHRVLELAPKMPEAHVNMGYALIGLEEYKAAGDFFDTATALKPMQTNAYYGLALAYEGQKDYPLAISAMESFIHLAKDDHPYLDKTRSASWEWGEHIRIAKSGEPAPRIVGRDIKTKELVNKAFEDN